MLVKLPQKKARKYTKADRDNAFEVYCESRSPSITSKLTGIPVNTINKWKQTYEWDKRANQRVGLKMRQFDKADPKFEELCRQLGVDDLSMATLREIESISKICLCSILGVNERAIDNLNLKPLSFKEATQALKVCWEMKNKIIAQAQSRLGVSHQDNRKIDFINQVHYHFGETNVDGPGDEREALSRPEDGSRTLPDKSL